MFNQKKLVLSLCAIASMSAFGCDDDGGSSNKAGSSCTTPLDCGDVKQFACQLVDEKKVCVNKDLCSNGKLDTAIGGAETDVDCGGLCGSTCKLNQKCAETTDCVLGLSCNNGVCGAATCTDDTQCNGGTCDTSNGTCISCADGIKNGNESDVDCGGTCSNKCDAGKACTVNTDCANSDCKNGFCSTTVLETVDPKTLLINEVMGSPDAKKFFATQEETAQCEFVEIINLSNSPAKLDGLFLNTAKDATEITDATDKHIDLQGTIPAKGVAVVSECPIPMPEDGININEGISLKMTNNASYALWIANEAGDASEYVIRQGSSSTGKSQNRSKDLSSASADLVKHDTVSATQLNSSPGYCANGDLISSGCVGGGVDVDPGDLELVDLTGLVINEIFDSGSKSSAFTVSGTEQKACEFAEIVNTTDKEINLATVSLVLEQIDVDNDNTIKSTTPVKLNGKLPAKNIVVVSSCTDNALDEIHLPSTARAIPAKTSKLFTGTWTYDIYLQSSNGTDTVKGDVIEKLAINSVTTSSFNRETDFSSAASMLKTTDLMASNAENFKYFATPGYCANGGIYSEGCALTCGNGQLDSDETDLDCGGSCSIKCAEGKSCKVDSDCASEKCEEGKCVVPEAPQTCNNNILDSDEADIDCGGVCSVKCDEGKTCTANSDCASNKCDAGKCTAFIPEKDKAKLSDLIINEVMGQPNTKLNFAIQTTTAQCEFIEIRNISERDVIVDGIVINMAKNGTDYSSSVSKTAKLSGKIPAKGVLVISEKEIPMPKDAINITGISSVLTNSAAYAIWFSNEAGETAGLVQIPANVSAISHNRKIDGDATSIDFIEHNTNNLSTYTNSPGYCANGGLFTENCVVASSSSNENTCNNSILDGDETDVDCGGSCGKCAEGKKCKVDADCYGQTKCWYGGTCEYPEY